MTKKNFELTEDADIMEVYNVKDAEREYKHQLDGFQIIPGKRYFIKAHLPGPWRNPRKE
jgi:hypothetical protein